MHQTGSFHEQDDTQELDTMISPSITSVSLDEINQMDIIIDKSNCDDALFQNIIEQLKKDGFSFTVTQNEMDINQNNATIITIDQMNDPNSVSIVAPYDNARVGQSDSLALSMQMAFQQNGFTNDTITCGKKDFREEDSTIYYSSPTDTEKAINEGYDSSFVTLSFPPEETNSERIARIIEMGLARHSCYLMTDNQTDLIYRANSGDSLGMVASYFGTDINRLKEYNHITDTSFQDAQAVINPAVSYMPAFSQNLYFEIEKEGSYTI